MNVLFWTEWSWEGIGGVETFGRQLTTSLQARGIHFGVVANSWDGKIRQDTLDGLPLWQMPMSKSVIHRDLPAIGQTMRTLHAIKREFQPDLIHLNTILSSSFFYLQVEKSWQLPMLLTLHNALDIGVGQSMIPRMLGSATYCAAVSQAILEQAHRWLPAVATRSCLVYNALLPPPVAPTPRPRTPPVLLCVGRLADQKGFDIAIRAFPKIVAAYPEARLVIAGVGTDARLLRSLVEAGGMTEAVEFVGRLTHAEVYQWMNRATLVLVPSRYETFGLVALEAAQMARPVVATRVDGLTEVIADGETGLLVPAEEVDALAEATLTLLRDPDRADRYGLAAQRRAAALFDFDRFVDRYEALYHHVVERHAATV